jgi:predicted alpha/beta hydrolase family esterase
MKPLFFLIFWGWYFVATAQTSLEAKISAQEDCAKKVALVMVHGFGGSENSWNHWVELIQKDASLSCVNVYTFSYETGFKAQEPKLDEISASLRQELGKLSAQGQELFLMAHSMGGIIIKKSLLQDLSAPIFLPHVKQVFFIASPHSGVRRPIALFAGMKSDQVKELRRPNIRELRHQWESPEEQDKLSSYAITFTAIVGTKDSIVPRYSASGGFSDVLKLSANHNDARDPGSEESVLYQKVKQALIVDSE